MKKRGSAIVIAMLLISAIGVITFGIARLIFIENRTVALYENGAVAYYAAESGLEEGFLRYRYNQNVEVPFGDWKLGENKVYKTVFNDYNDLEITNDYNNKNGISPNTSIEPTQQTYDLRIGHIGSAGKPYYGIPYNDENFTFTIENFKTELESVASADFNSQYGAVFIPKNDSIKIDLSGYDFFNNKINLYAKLFRASDIDISKRDCRSLIEIKFTIKDNNRVTENNYEYKDMIMSNIAGYLDSNGIKSCDNVLNAKGININRTIIGEGSQSDGNGNDMYYHASNLWSMISKNGGKNYSQEETKKLNVILTIHPIYYDVAIGLVSEGCSPRDCGSKDLTKENVVSGPFTTVESTGYFAGVAKKLTANIDRQSGSLYDLYDYVIFAQN